MKQIKITQVKSSIGASQRQKANLEALGLHKINQTKVHSATPDVLGMVNKVNHLINVEEV